MTWTCPARFMRGDEYVRHSLKPNREGVIDGFWICTACFTKYQTEDLRFQPWEPDLIEEEDEPTDRVEATAIALACAASTPIYDIKVSGPFHHYTAHFASASGSLANDAVMMAYRSFHIGRAWYAEAEALIRTGEVKPR